MPRDLPRSRMAPARLIGADTVVPCRRRSLAPLRQPRLRGEHSGDGRRVGRRRGVRPLVQQRAPRQRPEVPGLHRRVRGRARDGRRVRRRPRRGRRRLRPQHDRGDQRPVGRAARRARGCSRARSSITPTCFPGGATISGCSRSPARRTSCSTHASARFARRGRGSTWSPSPAPRTSPARCGRSPSSPSSPTPTARSCSSTPRSSLRTAPIDMAGAGIDFLALSGHKLYAPFGAGALVGDRRRLGDGEPLLHGGGAIELVTLDDVIWADAPERHEAGSPNVVGRRRARRGLPRPCSTSGWTPSPRTNGRSPRTCWSGLDGVPGLRRLTLWPDDVDRVGVATFNLDGYRHPLLAADPERRVRDRRPPRLLLRAPAASRGCSTSPTPSSTASPPSCGRDGVRPSREPSGRASDSAPRRTTSTA